MTDGNKGFLSSVVVVSGSKSKEIEWVVSESRCEDFDLVLLDNPAKFTPQGLNIGIEYALANGAEVIQMLGAHSSLNDGYFKNLSQIAKRDKDVAIFSPCYDFPQAGTMIERSIQLFHLSRLGRNWQRISGVSRPVPGFGSGAFAVRREVFDAIGLFDEKFIRNQDNEFYHRAVKKGFRGYAFPELVYYYRTRKTLVKLKKQNFDYGKYFALDPFSHSAKQAAPALFYTLQISLLLITGIFHFFDMSRSALFTIGSFMMILGIYLTAIMVESLSKFIKYGLAAVSLPSILIMMHFYYAMGSFSGFLFGFEKSGDKNKQSP
ncbi:hypothetical protein MASR1M107_21070 [Ignavibacteriales bacterium]